MTSPRTPLRARLTEELRAYAIATLYLYVCLGIVLLYKGALLREQGVNTLHFGIALGKALILGKFLLIGEAARLGARARSRSLLALIVRKVLLFLLLLAALSVVEEFLVGWLQGHAAAQTLAEYRERGPLELFATCLVMLGMLTPFIAAREIDRALAPGGLRRLLARRPE